MGRPLRWTSGRISYELLIQQIGMEFSTGNYSRRSSNPFCSDIDRSWFDMVYALLVPGRVNISINETLSDPAF